MVRNIFFLLAVVVFMANNCQIADAQRAKSKKEKNPAGEMTLVVMGEGFSKEDAVKSALRSAIEQCYGVFVSSNTAILNSKLVKDEIVTVSSGNIKKYDIISEIKVGNTWQVTTNATVSIGNLIKFAQSKGSEAELAGNLFAKNIELELLARKNQTKILENLRYQVRELVKLGVCSDYKITVDEPSRIDTWGWSEEDREKFRDKEFKVRFCIRAYYNDNAEVIHNLIYNTFKALSVTQEYANANSNAGDFCYERFKCDDNALNPETFLVRCFNDSLKEYYPQDFRYLDLNISSCILTVGKRQYKLYDLNDQDNIGLGQCWIPEMCSGALVKFGRKGEECGWVSGNLYYTLDEIKNISKFEVIGVPFNEIQTYNDEDFINPYRLNKY